MNDGTSRDDEADMLGGVSRYEALRRCEVGVPVFSYDTEGARGPGPMRRGLGVERSVAAGRDR